MKDRRGSARQRSFLQGRIHFNNRRSSVDCLVRDLSELGAKLKVSQTAAIPEVVELHIPNRDESYRAVVQWRTGDEVGVAFEPEKGAPSIVPDAAPSDLRSRVRRLENEVSVLQRRVNELLQEQRKRQGVE
jgi:uncharacterized protein YceH (UPF0502 family)